MSPVRPLSAALAGQRSLDLALAAALVALGAALAYLLVGGIPLIGIDDAAITRSYSENVASGAGYVYNVGGERVEGSTTFLWMLLLTLVYSLTATPEPIILLLCALLSFTAVYSALRLAHRLAIWFDLDPTIIRAGLAAILLAIPGYFLWTVWTMMEVALWSAALLAFLVLLSDLAEGEDGRVTAPGILLLATLLPLIRPEGIAVSAGLLCLALILRLSAWRLIGAALALTFGAFVALTLFRISYFGQPFPNTFYAKVSSDTLQGLKDGLKYLFDFVLSGLLIEAFVVAWAGAAIFALLRLKTPGAKALLLAAATIFGTLAIYAALGGDHFVLWRFYQPIGPLLPVAFVLALAAAIRVRMAWWSVGAAAAALMVLGWVQYYQARFDILKEYALVERGLGFGTYLNTFEPRPSIGVGPAGGIALAYDGQIYDLLGLNWTVMAHANPVKEGMRNHASFDKPTFWAHQPDVLSAFNRACTRNANGTGQAFWSTDDAAFDGLFTDPDFRAAYIPVRFTSGDECWPGFAQPDWLETAEGPGLERLEWDTVEIRQ